MARSLTSSVIREILRILQTPYRIQADHIRQIIHLPRAIKHVLRTIEPVVNMHQLMHQRGKLGRPQLQRLGLHLPIHNHWTRRFSRSATHGPKRRGKRKRLSRAAW